MDLTRVILGPVVTEKAERQKTEARTHTLRVDQNATKVDVRVALKKYYDIDVASIRALRTRPKTRTFGRGQTLEKRHREKRMIITLAEKSKTLDLSTFKTS